MKGRRREDIQQSLQKDFNWLSRVSWIHVYGCCDDHLSSFPFDWARAVVFYMNILLFYFTEYVPNDRSANSTSPRRANSERRLEEGHSNRLHGLAHLTLLNQPPVPKAATRI